MKSTFIVTLVLLMTHNAFAESSKNQELQIASAKISALQTMVDTITKNEQDFLTPEKNHPTEGEMKDFNVAAGGLFKYALMASYIGAYGENEVSNEKNKEDPTGNEVDGWIKNLNDGSIDLAQFQSLINSEIKAVQDNQGTEHPDKK